MRTIATPDRRTTVLGIAALLMLTTIGCSTEPGTQGSTSDPAATQPTQSLVAPADLGTAAMDYRDWQAVLTHVDDRGLVDYATVVDDPAALERFVDAIAALDPDTFAQWSEDARIAFLSNAYNALTIQAIIDAWPLEREAIDDMMHPRGIRWISGVWDSQEWTVMGRAMTLDAIEHETLRKDYVEPRIHAALVCAAMSCPPLRNEPFVGDRLDAQLDDQMRAWVGNPAIGLAIDREAGSVRLSKIFDWYGIDFVVTDLPEEGFGDAEDKVRASLSAAADYLSDEDAAYLEVGDYSAGYLDYDWSLNEQP